MNYNEIEKVEVPQIKEELVPYLASKRQGEYTIEDYFALPDEHRVELIDGVIYDMASPVDVHQIIGDQLNTRFYLHIQKKKGKCISVTAPLDVQLDCDDRTIVQPDVLIVCDRDKFKKGRIYGAPDFVVEVLSPSTRKKDIYLKTEKYRRAGVREYWIVDPKKKLVYVNMFEKGDLTKIYTFEDKIPVGIFDNECEVDFAEIFEYISFLYE